MRIANEGPFAIADDGGFLGALPPGPAPAEGDWFTRLMDRWREAQEDLKAMGLDQGDLGASSPPNPVPPSPPDSSSNSSPSGSSRRSVTAPSPDRAVAEWVLEIGGSLQLFDPARPSQPDEYPIKKLDQLPSTPFELYRVNLDGNRRVTDEDLTRFDGLKKLKRLSLTDTRISNDGLDRLGELPTVKDINIGATRVDSSGVRSLVRFQTLGTLGVQSIALTDDDARFLSDNLPKLAGLYAARTKITDAGFRTLVLKPTFNAGQFSGITDEGAEALRNRTNFFVLHLYDSNITREGVAAIATCSNLTELYLSNNTAIDDGCVAEIAKLTKLTRLTLYGPTLTDACVDDLAQLKNLKQLTLGKTRITPAALARLRAALPGCTIEEK